MVLSKPTCRPINAFRALSVIGCAVESQGGGGCGEEPAQATPLGEKSSSYPSRVCMRACVRACVSECEQEEGDWLDRTRTP